MEQSGRKTRGEFLINAGRLVGACACGAAAWRIFGSADDPDANYIQPTNRFAWQIDSTKCTFCGKCETACIRKPSAVKAVNDQENCSYCVVCYGHITNKHIESNKIDSDGKRVCPQNAVVRTNHCGGLDGYYLYTINESKCIACGKCAERCNKHGSESMYLMIRPDLCVGCNHCTIAAICPENAVERVPMFPEDDLRDDFFMDMQDPSFFMGEEG